MKYMRERYRNNPEVRKKVLERSRQQRKSHRDGFYSVYYLPEEHYIGITKAVKERIASHKRYGKMTDGFEVVAKFEREVDAHWLETMFHMRGYNGYHKQDKGKCYAE